MNLHNILSLQRAVAASVVVSLTMLLTAAEGANIVWGGPQQITGDSDVSTNGTLVGAFNVGGPGVPSTTVNGVVFQSFPTTGGNGAFGNFTTFGGGGGIGQTNTGHGSTSAPFTTLSAAYQTLLQSAAVPFASPMTLVISGLVVGMQYEFQWWANDSSTENGRTRATAGNIVELAHNTSAVGGLGQWVIGTFTADAVTQSITFRGDGDFGSFNAFQLRQIGAPSQVPDSGSTAVLLGSACAALVVIRRHRSRGRSVAC